MCLLRARLAVVDRRVGAVAVEALRVIGKGEIARMPAVRPIDIVVTGAAGHAVRNETPVARLRRVFIGFLVAGLAVAHVLGEVNLRVIVHGTAEADDEISVLQVHAGVNLVNHLGHVDRSAPGLIDRIAVDGGGVVAGHAVGNVRSGTAVKFEAVVAGKTGIVIDDVAGEVGRAAGRDEIVNAVR